MGMVYGRISVWGWVYPKVLFMYTGAMSHDDMGLIYHICQMILLFSYCPIVLKVFFLHFSSFVYLVK